MQTIQFKVDDNYLNIVLTLLHNLKIDIIKDLSIFKDKKQNSKNDILTKFINIDNRSKSIDKSKDFLALGGSDCWIGDIKEMREDRVDYGSSR